MQPSHISLRRSQYENASKSFSSLLLIWIYLRQRRDADVMFTVAPSRRRELLWMVGFIACGARCLWVDRSGCPCFIDPSSHKFTTSAVLVLGLTGRDLVKGWGQIVEEGWRERKWAGGTALLPQGGRCFRPGQRRLILVSVETQATEQLHW